MKLFKLAALFGLAAANEHFLSLDKLQGTSTEINLEVKDYVIVQVYENPDLGQKFYTNMEKESRDILFFIWSNYQALAEGESIPIQFNKVATHEDGTEYHLPKGYFDAY